MPIPDEPTQSTTYWRSLEELAGTREFRDWVEAEFPTEAQPAGLSRRHWLQLMGRIAGFGRRRRVSLGKAGDPPLCQAA